jgi:hypothetical protein
VIANEYDPFDAKSIRVYHFREITYSIGDAMVLPKAEEEWGQRASAFLKSEMKKADVTYADLVKRLKKHGLKDETEAGITMKLKRGSFTAIFFLACVAALELEQVVLEEI